MSMKNPCMYARRNGDPMRCVSPGESPSEEAGLRESHSNNLHSRASSASAPPPPRNRREELLFATLWVMTQAQEVGRTGRVAGEVGCGPVRLSPLSWHRPLCSPPSTSCRHGTPLSRFGKYHVIGSGKDRSERTQHLYFMLLILRKKAS